MSTTTFNPAMLLYMNPELQAFSNIITVEQARDFHDAGNDANLVVDYSPVPKAFDEQVYISDNKNVMNISGLNQVIKAAMLNDGEDEEGLERDGRYYSTIYRRGLLYGLNTFRVNDAGDMNIFQISPSNLNVGDWVKIIKNNSEFHYGKVTSILDTETFTLSNNRYAFLDSNAEYIVHGIKLYDPLRLARIAYMREYSSANAGPPPDSGLTKIDAKFNYELYKMLYPDARLLSREAAFIDYINRLDNNDVRIGRTADIKTDSNLPEFFKYLTVTNKLVLDFDATNGRMVWNGVNLYYVTSNDRRSSMQIPPYQEGLITERAIKTYIDRFFSEKIQLNNVEVTGFVNFKENANFYGTTIMSNLEAVHMNVASNAGFYGVTSFNNTATFNDPVIMNDRTTFESNVTFNDPAVFNDTIVANAPVSLKNTLTVDGATRFNSNVIMMSNATFSNTTNFASNVNLYGTNTFEGTALFKNVASFCNNVIFTSNVTLNGTVLVNNNLDVSSNLGVKSVLTVEGNAVMNSNLTVSGEVTLNSNVLVKGTLTVDRQATIKDHLIVNSNVNIIGNLMTSGATTLGQVTAFGVSASNISSSSLSTSNVSAVTVSNVTTFTSNLSSISITNSDNIRSKSMTIDHVITSASNITLDLTTSNINASNVMADAITCPRLTSYHIETSNIRTDIIYNTSIYTSNIYSLFQHNESYISKSNLTDYLSSSNFVTNTFSGGVGTIDELYSTDASFATMYVNSSFTSNSIHHRLEVLNAFASNITLSNGTASNFDIVKLNVLDTITAAEMNVDTFSASNIDISGDLDIAGSANIDGNTTCMGNVDVYGSVGSGGAVYGGKIGIVDYLTMHPLEIPTYSNCVFENIHANDSISANGRVSFGTPQTENDKMLKVYGIIEATNIDVTSDSILKTDYEPIHFDNVMKSIDNVKVIKYRYRHKNSKRKRIGVIAQNLEQYLEETVSEIENYTVEVNKYGTCKTNDLTIISALDHGFHENEVLEILHDKNRLTIVQVVRVIDGDTIQIDQGLDSRMCLIKRILYKNIKSVDYNQLSCVLLGCIQELNKKVKRLENVIFGEHT